MAAAGGSRVLTVVAASFLAFDGAALVAGGVWLHRTVLVVVGAVLVLGSLLVGYYWRWHRRQLVELNQARRELAADARELQDLLRRN